jgi:hypothetical protein
MWSDFADRCKIKGTMRLLIASKQTNGGSVLLAAELWKRVADNRAGPWLGHKNIQHTVRYTELAPDRFKDFWR